MDKGLGAVTWWGFSPAIDVLEYFKLCDFKNKRSTADHHDITVNVLLVGGADIRHILKTMTKLKFKQFQKVHFYILEHNLENYARILLLMSLALEKFATISLQEKTELMAEIFGNSLIRAQTASYIHELSNDFVKMVTDFDELNEKLPLFSLEALKYKERDMLEGIFKLWRKPDKNIFDIEQCWDLRIRQYLGTRYDTSKGAFDWDYSMKLSDRGAEIIGTQCYQRWRKTGVAFELRDGAYDMPNKTLASGLIFKNDGERHGRRGYWGDIVVSPYIAFGIECDDEEFFKRANKQFVSNSEAITKHNLTTLLYELQTGKAYKAITNLEPDTTMETIGEEEDNDELDGAGGDRVTCSSSRSYLSCDNVKITFLPLNSLPELSKKEKYQNMFDQVYFSNSMVHHLTPEVTNIFANNASIILETAKFITELTKEQYIAFTNKIDSMAKAAGCETLIDCCPEKDAFSFYKFQRQTSST
ncbi:DNAAF3 [Bugula neritina]|uniref:DNAAF3 n=1 Tax=Bugula neritina TaxID=10212 RepID=A0A7J7JJA8_BUGNE|nr:DNAAF3 [Bugula neritina]